MLFVYLSVGVYRGAKTMKYRARIKDYRLNVRVKCGLGQKLDLQRLDTFARAYPRGFLKVIEQTKGQATFTGTKAVTLKTYLIEPITRRDFLLLIEQLASSFRQLEDAKLAVAPVVLEPEHIYINVTTKELQLLYVPLMSQIDGGDVAEALRKIVETILYSATPAADGDTDFVARFAAHFNSLGQPKPEEIEKYISQVDPDVVKRISKLHAGQSGFIASSQAEYLAHYGTSGNAVTGGNVVNNLLDDDEGTKHLGEDDNDGATELLIEGGDDGGTRLLSQEEPVARALPRYRLRRLSCGELTSISKSPFVVGKERARVDYCVSVPTVSRQHAEFILQGERLYIKDMGSSNGTFVQGERLAAHMQRLLNPGDAIMLAQEEFVLERE